MEKHGDQTSQLLPDDMLAAVLGCLAPRGLATSRCVCKAWRDTVDARRLLRVDLLPHSLAGFFINFHDMRYSEFFARPPSPSSNGIRNLVYPRMDGHCNGLLMFGYHNMVANPATGWSAPLPPPPPKRPGMDQCLLDDAYLAFDPTESPHYQVLLVPRIPYIDDDDDEEEEDSPPINMLDPAMYGSEWPPSSWVLRVFSSLTNRWEERTFLREGDAAGTVAELGSDYSWSKSNAVYWHGALHVHCQRGFVMRFWLSSHKYEMIKPPEDIEPASWDNLHHIIGKSKKGVYYALLNVVSLRFRVWVLDDSCTHSKWVLEHDAHLKLPSTCINSDQQVYGPWTLLDVNYSEEFQLNDGNNTSVVEENFEWNSDDDEEANVLDTKDMVTKFSGDMWILGFHPFKEIVFMSRSLSRGLAYHLNTSKIQDLGNLFPKNYDGGQHPFIEVSFPYTPCWME